MLSADIPRQQFTGTGSATVFTFPYLFFNNSDLTIYRLVISTGVESIVPATEYTVTGAGVATGGSVTFGIAPTTDHRITILRIVPYAQTTDYVSFNGFPANSHEIQEDKLTMMTQQISEELTRTVRLPISINDSITIDPTLPLPVAGQQIIWNATATGFVNSTIDATAAAASAAAAAASAVSAAAAVTAALASSFQYVIDGGGSTIGTGIAGFIRIPFGGTITKVTLLADQSGSVVVDIWKDTYANYAPTNADSITASAPPTITSTNKSEDSTLTGWTKTVVAGDILGFNVDSVTSITRLTIVVDITKDS